MSGKLVSMRKLAGTLGVALNSVQNAIRTGRIQPQEILKQGSRTRYVFDEESAVRDFHANKDPTKKFRATRAEMGKGPQPTSGSSKKKKAKKPDTPQSAPGENIAQPVPGQTNLSKARTMEVFHKAKLTELKYRAAAGELVEIKKVNEKISELAGVIKKNLLSVADRIAPLAAAETDPKKVYLIISQEIKTALRAISEKGLNA